jgi:hypothetical protein
MRSMLALVLAPLVGCAGSVTVDEVDGFGMVASAVWFHYDDSDWHQVVLSNVPGLCQKTQALQDAYDEVEDASEDIGTNEMDEYCAILEGPTRDFARAANAISHEGAHYLSFVVSEGGDTEPDDDTYEVGGDPSVSISATYWENSPYAAILADYDPEEDDYDCGLDGDDLEPSTDTWSADEGELDITVVNDEASLRATFEGELIDPDGDDAGDIKGSFTATYCEVG